MENVRQGSGLEKARVMWHRRQWLALLVCVLTWCAILLK